MRIRALVFGFFRDLMRPSGRWLPQCQRDDEALRRRLHEVESPRLQILGL